MEDKKVVFERLGDMRPHQARINLDSFTNFKDPDTERKKELRKGLLLKKFNLLKSLEQEEGQTEILKELATLYNVPVIKLNKALSNMDLEKAEFSHNPANAKEVEKVEEKTSGKLKKIVKDSKDKKEKEAAEEELNERGEIKKEAKLEKANKGYPIGTIHNGYKKVADGDWRKIKNAEHGILEKNGKKYSEDEVIEEKKKFDIANKILSDPKNVENYSLETLEGLKRNKLSKKLSSIVDAQIEKYKKGKDLEKGIISDLSYSLNNGKEGLNFTKTGKEIKQQLPTLISSLKTQLNNLENKCTELIKEIGEEPTEDAVAYNTNEAYKRYSSELCYGKSDSISTADDEQKKMRMYNDMQYNINDVKGDIKMGETMVRNLDDKKKYTLNIRQLSSLGF